MANFRWRLVEGGEFAVIEWQRTNNAGQHHRGTIPLTASQLLSLKQATSWAERLSAIGRPNLAQEITDEQAAALDQLDAVATITELPSA